jgi:hypothetical protein
MWEDFMIKKIFLVTAFLMASAPCLAERGIPTKHLIISSDEMIAEQILNAANAGCWDDVKELVGSRFYLLNDVAKCAERREKPELAEELRAFRRTIKASGSESEHSEWFPALVVGTIVGVCIGILIGANKVTLKNCERCELLKEFLGCYCYH